MRRGITFRLVGEPELNEDEVQLARSAFARGHEVTSLLLGRQKKREEKDDEEKAREDDEAGAVQQLCGLLCCSCYPGAGLREHARINLEGAR